MQPLFFKKFKKIVQLSMYGIEDFYIFYLYLKNSQWLLISLVDYNVTKDVQGSFIIDLI